MLWLQEHSQDTEHSHEDDGEGLPGDGHVAPRPHGDGGGGEAADEHVDQVIVMPGYVSLHIGSEIMGTTVDDKEVVKYEMNALLNLGPQTAVPFP